MLHKDIFKNVATGNKMNSFFRLGIKIKMFKINLCTFSHR